MSLYDKYKKDVLIKDIAKRQRERDKIRRDFEEVLSSSGNGYNIEYFMAEDIPSKHFDREDVIIDDGGNYVDNTNSDSKKLLCRLDSGIKVGTYIFWGDMHWMVVSEDKVTVGAYKRFGIKPCYVYISKRIDNRIVDFPVVYDTKASSFKDTESNSTKAQAILDITSASIIIPNEAILRDITALNKRVMVRQEKVYKIKKEEPFVSVGVVHIVMEQDVITENDNMLNNIADDVLEKEVSFPSLEVSIQGDSIAKIGSKKEYTIVTELDALIDEEFSRQWLFEVRSVSGKDINNIIENLVIDNTTMSFRIIKNVNNINEKLLIGVYQKIGSEVVTEEIITEKEVLIKGLI